MSNSLNVASVLLSLASVKTTQCLWGVTTLNEGSTGLLALTLRVPELGHDPGHHLAGSSHFEDGCSFQVHGESQPTSLSPSPEWFLSAEELVPHPILTLARAICTAAGSWNPHYT